MSDDDRLSDMAATVLEQGRPWTEERFFALGKTASRVELFDGSLLVSPAPSIWHQDLGLAIRDALLSVTREAELRIHLATASRQESMQARPPIDLIRVPRFVCFCGFTGRLCRRRRCSSGGRSRGL